MRTPTELPSRNKATQSHANVPANEENIPNTAVKKRVALNAVVRPMRSEPVKTRRQANAQQVFRRALTCPPAYCTEHHAGKHRRGQRADVSVTYWTRTLNKNSFCVPTSLTSKVLLYSWKDDGHCLYPHLRDRSNIPFCRALPTYIVGHPP